MPLPFNKSLDIKLLKLVRDNPCLYNTNHSKYMDFDEREVVWQKIGDALNRPAVEFAGIQCQIHYGDFQEEKHKTGLIENLREYLPEQYATSWGIEKKILKEYRKHQGISPIDAKYLYTKTARDLPTYGVTFFLVKEKQKGRKKLIPRLLGINANSILRLDEVTKEILQVWPLTQVKSYQVGKSETFTLNFGDYSDKEYCVKTNDAVRIRDILQGYIDIIGKRMAAAYNSNQSDHHTIGEDVIMVSRGNVMQHVAHNPSKIIEESFVGPTKIISYEPGQTVSQGTQLVTVQQMIVTNMGSKEQFAVSGEVALRKDMSMECVRKLNRMNSNSVRIVTELSDPNENSIAEAQKIVDIMLADLPSIITGVKESAEKQTDEDAKKKLLAELQDLCDYVNELSASMKGPDFNIENAGEAAKKIADLSTRMYFSMDPGTRRRSEFCRRSRKSFIKDEKKDAAMRRASFIAAAAGACSAVEDAKNLLSTKYQGPKLSAIEEELLENAALDKMGKLNAAVALYLMAHAEPNNIDYSAGVTSMNTINELMPEIGKDAQILSSCKDAASKQALLDDMQRLFEATRLICSLTGCTDHEKIQEVASNYAGVSGKLVFTISRGANDDKDNEIINLSKEVGDKTSLLLMKANELTSLAPTDSAAAEVDAAGVICADAARNLLACAMLTAPSIHEPHCQSALTAAAETLSSSAQKVIAASKPIIDDPSRHHHGDELRTRSLDLAKALDRLTNAYGNRAEEHDHRGTAEQEKQRLKFIATIAKTNKALEAAEKELKKPPVPVRDTLSSASIDEVEYGLALKIAQVNSAVAALTTATSNREKPDYATAVLAIDTINELMPGIVKETKTVSASKNAAVRAAMLADVKELCEATRAICANADSGKIEELNESAAKFANTSNKLFYIFSPLTPEDREQKIINISTAACGKASQMLANVYQLAEETRGELGADLDGRGAATADAAKAFLTSAQLTAACIEEPRCQSVLIASADALLLSAHDLAKRWSPLLQQQKCAPLVKQLNQEHGELQQELSKLKEACQDIGRAQGDSVQQRLRYIVSLNASKDCMRAIDEEFNQQLPGVKPMGEEVELEGQMSQKVAGVTLTFEERVVLKQKLSQRLAQLNAALAALVATSTDQENLDYVAAEEVLNTINKLMPQVVKDTKVLARGIDDKTNAAMMEDLRALIEATRGICDDTEFNPKTFNDLATKFANASSELIFAVNPRAKRDTESQIIGIAQAAQKRANQLVNDIKKMASEVDTAAALDLVQCGHNMNLAADALLTSAKLTAPCINVPRCQLALASSADRLRVEAQELSKCWALLQDPLHKPYITALEGKHQQLMQDLNKLKTVCCDFDKVQRDGVGVRSREEQRLLYSASLGSAKKFMCVIDEEFSKPATGARPKEEAAVLRELQMSQRMAQLNAAMGDLAAATSDRDNSDYATADQAINTIIDIMPQVVEDTKVMAEGKDDKTRAIMMEHLRALIDATTGICDDIETRPEKFNDLATKFANASSKLIFIVNPRAKPNAASQVIGIAQAAHKSANELVKDINKLASVVNADAAGDMIQSGQKTQLAANAVLTAAQLSAPCISEPRCQSTLASSVDKLEASAHVLSKCWIKIQDQMYKPYITALEKKNQQLLQDLHNLLSACSNFGKDKIGISKANESQNKEQHKLHFINTAVEAKKAVIAAERELDKPVVGSPPKGEAAVLQRQQLSQRLAQLNAALAALASATADHKNIDHIAAEKAIVTIKDLMPSILKNANALTAAKDEATRAAAVAELHALCDAVRDICENAEKQNPAKLNDCISQKAVGTLGKLYYIVNPDTIRHKQNEIVDLSKSASHKASQLMSDVYQLAKAENIPSPELDVKVAAVAEAAKALLTAVQLTGPYVHEAEGQSTLVSSADALSAAATDLTTVITPILKDPRFGPKIRDAHKGLETELEKMRRACRDVGKDDGIIQKSVYKAKVPLPNKTDDKDKSHALFAKSVEENARIIQAAEEDIKNVYNGLGAASLPLDRERLMSTQQNLENKLAQANASAATLLACNTPDSMDFVTASKTTNTMNILISELAKEAKILSKSLADKDRKVFLDDILAMFDSTKKLCDVANNDRKKLNEVAVDFGNRSAKVLYAISTDIDPNNEKEVIMRAKEIGDGASRIAMCSTQLVSDVDEHKARELCTAGGRCADAAGTLVYTTKLVAPSIQNKVCQETLKTATQNLSSQLKSFTTTWQPLSANPQLTPHIQQLSAESAKLETLLGGLKGDIESGKLVVKKVKLVVEDTPLRILATAVLNNAKKQTTSSTVSPERRRAYKEYVKSLEDAIKAMDIANAICKINPHDLEKRKALEDAVQTLQVVTLQMRPALADKPQNNIVDLTDFVKDLSKEAELLIQATNQCPSANQDFKKYCHSIHQDACRVLNPGNDDHNRGYGITIDDINEFDRLGRVCANDVKKLYSEINKMSDAKDKNVLHDKVTSLEDSCNMLRFATQCANATAQSASLDETLNDLTDLEKTIDLMLAAGDKRGAYITEPIPWSVRTNLVSSARSNATHPQLAGSLAAYVDEHRARTNLCDPAERNKLKEHLKKLIHLLKIITVTASRRVATWQQVDGPEVATITEHILKEIDAACDKHIRVTGEKSVLQNIDMNKLLLSSEAVKIEGERKHVQDKLQQTATKLSSMTATIIASAQKPDSLARSLQVTVDTAAHLAALARALQDENDPIQNAKIEEVTREMTLQTYNVLKASELVSQDSSNPVYRRRLLDACRLLNDALNRLGRATSPSNNLQTECNELTRNMQLQQSLLQGVPQPTSSLPYSDCVDALHSQQEVIQKLNNEKAMSREEFSRTLSYVTSAVNNSTEIAAQCAYFLALSERDSEVAKAGVVDLQRLRTVTESTQNICYRILRFEPEQVKEEEANLIKQVGYLKQALSEAADKSKHLKEELTNAGVKVDKAFKELQVVVHEKIPERAKITASTLKLIDSIKTISSLTDHPSLVPKVSDVTAEAQQRCDDVLKNCRDLTSKTITLIREVKTSEDRDPMTWAMFNTSRNNVLKVFETLLNSVKENGKRARVLELSQAELEEEMEMKKKSYVQIQVELVNKWLKLPACKPEIKSLGETACQRVIEIAEKMANDLKGAENEEICQLIVETKQLLTKCSKKYDAEKSRLLMERLKELRKCIERGVVTMIVEEFIEGEEPLADLEVLVDAEKDESKRKFLLERKIAELLAQLGRVTKTARFVADSGSGGQTVSVELKKCTDQAELLAPLLVKAAQERVTAPDNEAAIEKYKSLLAQYAESLSKVRDLCDQSVDPMDFVQTAGETMQKMRAESSHESDPYKCAYVSTAITKLAKRVMHVSMSSHNVKRDPELHKAMMEAQKRMSAAVPSPDTRQSKLPDWKVTTAEILRTTGEVESVLGGEMIFQKQPEPDQPIFAAAAGLHAAVRDWSARDNEIVAVAKRMAVLMAKLSEYMNTNKKLELIVTSKSIASEAHEVAELARKLAHECTDVRIKTNLLKTCEKIPTISGQLKMLTTVKASSLGRQGSQEDQEDISMLVDNAQNLMLSIQDVVKVAAGASVKIMSQRGGPRVRWVRKNDYRTFQ